MVKTVKFYVFDSDESMIQILTHLIRMIYPDAIIESTTDGENAWIMLTTNNQQAIVITGIFLSKLNGLQLLQNIKSKDNLKDSYVVITFDNQDKEELLKALKLGADALLSKPVSIEGLISVLKTASKLFNLQQKVKLFEEKIEESSKLLDEDVDKMSNILSKFQELRIPRIQKNLTFISEATVWIAKKFGDTESSEINNIERAAKLCFIGKVGLPDKIIDKPVTRSGMISGENMSVVPILARDLANMVRNYEDVANILYHVFENFDGSGYPKKLMGWQIPFGSRIIRVVFDYMEYLEESRNNNTIALESLYHESKRLYDYKIVAYFDQFLGFKSINNSRMREKAIKLKDLTGGMILSRNINLESGIVLLGEGTYVKSEQIDKILQISKTDPYIGDIYVYIR